MRKYKIGDPPTFRTIKQIGDAFGMNVPRNGMFASDLKLSETPLADSTIIWFPKEVDPHWDNVNISNNWEYIEEIPKPSCHETSVDHYNKYMAKDEIRITFLKIHGKQEYKFLGVYKLDKVLSRCLQHCVWKRFLNYCYMP